MKGLGAPHRPRWLAAGLFLGAFPFAWFVYYSMDEGTYPVCPYRLLTGRPCLFCGITHALAYAAHGEWAKANACHPLWFVMALTLALLGVMALVRPHYLDRLARFCGDHWLALAASATALSLLRAFLP